MSKAKDKEPRFEEAVGELEALIEKIESGDAGLEECLGHYERGMKLISQCQTVLAAAQKRITELTADSKGKLSIGDAGAEKNDAGGEPAEPVEG